MPSPSSRRLLWGGVFLFLLVGRAPADSDSKPAVPITGKSDEKYARLDTLMSDFVGKHKLPGATLAVGHRGKLVYARGFGYADRDAKQVMKPDALFRISSLTKPFTAVAVLQLVEKGKLKLDDKVMDVLKLRPPARGFDERWKKVTVRHLLEHRGGWDAAEAKMDPAYSSPQIVKAMGGTHPAMPNTIIRYMLSQPLQFEPGEKFAYSNFGYILLGRVIEKASGMRSCSEYMQAKVFKPLGNTRMRRARSLLANRAPGEVRYHSDTAETGSVVPPIGRRMPFVYGGLALEAADAHAGWLGSAPDLVRLACDLEFPDKSKLLRAESVETMFARPQGAKGPVYYAKGWVVRPFGKGLRSYWHDGSLSGVSSLLVHRADGVTFAVMFNTREKVKDTEPAGHMEALLLEPLNALFAGK